MIGFTEFWIIYWRILALGIRQVRIEIDNGGQKKSNWDRNRQVKTQLGSWGQIQAAQDINRLVRSELGS